MIQAADVLIRVNEEPDWDVCYLANVTLHEVLTLLAQIWAPEPPMRRLRIPLYSSKGAYRLVPDPIMRYQPLTAKDYHDAQRYALGNLFRIALPVAIYAATLVDEEDL